MPPKKPVEVVADEEDDEYATRDGKAQQSKGGREGKTSNPNQNVGGTAKDGGVSTADTVADGGEDEGESDPDFKPS